MVQTHAEPGVRHVAEEGLSVPEDAVQGPGQTPPAESGVSDLDGPERQALRRGWGPVPITLIMCVVALVVAGMIAQLVALFG
ncbi:DUF6480 family protein [Streptomyces sp. V4-01]|uniref:DUF6480 family protein n=1 Tax=Actinacidiphila polyblastidii TaxID=3110430 RepID=A0ABU7PIL3_9ACTN|nr:DUF6480 family protein [Streptomyces sp. V4-01]